MTAHLAVMLEQEEPPPNCSHKVGSMKLKSKISRYAEALSVPFTETQGPMPTPENKPPSTKFYTCHNAVITLCKA